MICQNILNATKRFEMEAVSGGQNFAFALFSLAVCAFDGDISCELICGVVGGIRSPDKPLSTMFSIDLLVVEERRCES